MECRDKSLHEKVGKSVLRRSRWFSNCYTCPFLDRYERMFNESERHFKLDRLETSSEYKGLAMLSVASINR
jgi:hypothetical protein